jgi:FHA domain
MNKTITIGRNEKNDIPISRDNSISDFHAKVMQQEDGFYLVEDLQSTNGTFVNGRPIRKATIGLTDKLQVANYTINLADIFQVSAPGLNKKDGNDYSEEFKEKAETWYKWDNEKTKAEKVLLFKRTALMLIAPLLWTIISFTVLRSLRESKIIEDHKLYSDLAGGYIVISSIFSVIATLITTNPKHAKNRLRAAEKLRITYKCPNCNSSLGTDSPEYYYEQNSCNNAACKAVFS